MNRLHGGNTVHEWPKEFVCTSMRKPIDAFCDQRKSARRRGVGWAFTFEEWCNWWEAQLGIDWFQKRGHKTGQFVMARNGDKGPYASWNVRCATVGENHCEFNAIKDYSKKTYQRRFSKDEIVSIYLDDRKYAEIAEDFDVTVHRIHRIKCRKCYREITKGLTAG